MSLLKLTAEAEAHTKRLRRRGWTRKEFAAALRCALQYSDASRYYLADFDLGGEPHRLVPTADDGTEGEPEAMSIEEALNELCALRRNGMDGYAVVTETGEIIASV